MKKIIPAFAASLALAVWGLPAAANPPSPPAEHPAPGHDEHKDAEHKNAGHKDDGHHEGQKDDHHEGAEKPAGH